MARLRALGAACCFAAVAANSPTPQQRYGAEMRIYLREGNVEKTIHYCKLLGEECVKTETIRKHAPYCRRTVPELSLTRPCFAVGDKLLHSCAENGRYEIARWVIVNLGQEPDVPGNKGRTPYEKCEEYNSGENGGTRSQYLRPNDIGCDPDTWLKMTEEAMEMREKGLKIDHKDVKENTRGNVPGASLGKSTKEVEAERAAEKLASEERVKKYEAEQAAKPKTEDEKKAAREKKKKEMQERIAAKKAAKAAEKKEL